MKQAETKLSHLSRKELWERELDGGVLKKAIKEHWDRYSKLTHKYIHCDICANPERITSLITPE